MISPMTLLVLQKRALRFIHFANSRDHAIPLFLNTMILPLNFLYYKLLSETMHDVSNNLLPPNIQDLFLPTAHVHFYNTRSRNFYIQKSNLEIQKKSFSRTGAKLWNEIPTKLRNLPKRTFSKRIRNLLLALLESEDSYVDLETMISKLKMHDG